MRYFTDQQIDDMKTMIKTDMDQRSGMIYLTYLKRIEELDRQNDRYGNCRAELMEAISQFQRFSDNYIPHKEKIDINDEDADAYEYENYDYQPTHRSR